MVDPLGIADNPVNSINARWYSCSVKYTKM